MKNKILNLLGVFLLFQFGFIQNTSAQVIEVDMSDADIIDLGFPDNQRPKTPNAGTKVLEARKPLDAKFDFNRKISFKVSGQGKTFNSWFYLNLQEGYSMMDMAALKQMPMGGGSPAGDMVQIVDPDYVMYNYISSKEGKFAMKMGDESMAVMTDLKSEFLADEFFKNFTKTGKVMEAGKDGVPFKRAEYKGTYEGKPTTIWLSDAQDVLIDVKKVRTLTGHMGIGYIASAGGKTYLVSGVESDGLKVFVTGISKENKSFSGAGYQAIGQAVMAGKNPRAELEVARAEMQKAIDEEKDPKIKQLMIQQMEVNFGVLKDTTDGFEKFGKSSNITDLNSKTNEEEFYDNMLTSLQIEYRELELSLQRDHDPRSEARIRCEMSCNQMQQNRIERMNAETKAIRNQYANDSEKADELVSSYVDGVMAEMAANPCICGN